MAFECLCAVEVENADALEQLLHTLLDDHRVNKKREFFEFDAENLIPPLLKMGQDCTPSLSDEEHSADKDVSPDVREHIRRKNRPRLRFSDLDIQPGEALLCPRADAECTVAGDNEVKLGGKKVKFMEATKRVLKQVYGEGAAWIDRSTRPALHWEYKGKLLSKIYDERYPRDTEED